MMGVLKSLGVTAKHAIRGETFTVEYPEESPEVSPRFRGTHKFSLSRCISCRMCEEVCPNNTIEIKTDRKRNIEEYNLNLGQCIYCRLCEEVCPTDAIILTQHFELNAGMKAELEYTKEDLMDVPWYKDTDPLEAREPDRGGWIGTSEEEQQEIEELYGD
ncbi:MAG: NADH-quinone oxidoreductase subunit I [Halobacteria archaeon]|nr:NADH-quinone oxidoreductase subunit I [Halobacteria archaeon]